MLPYALLIIGFVLLIKGADFLVKGATSIARRLNISDLAIGLTVVAFGTSAPELFVNIVAGAKGTTDIAIGNVLGSNIANVFLILGISAIIYPLAVSKGTVWKEIPFSLLAAVVLAFLANDRLIDKQNHSVLLRSDGLILLSFFIIFLYYSTTIAFEIKGIDDHVPETAHGTIKSIGLVIVGLAGLVVGGEWIVNGAVHMAVKLGLSQSTVGLTVVAVGTSLPELATSAMAAYRKNVDIAVGNVVGSNIFNIFFVLGISSIVHPLPFSIANNIDIAMVILASLMLFVFMFTGKKRSLDRWEGIICTLIYICYITFLIYLRK
ncbi:MAG: calcium/sodium antiporter [Desulfobacterales bacterium]|jgi:cation:H+ antiporter